MRETRQLEFKEKITHYKDLNREIVAFLNDIGGEILIGISDNGKIVGLSEEQIEKYLEEIPSSIYNAIAPYCQPFISIQNVEEKQILSIKVLPSNKRPYFLKSKGIPDGVYIRIGTHAMPATPEIIEDLQRSNTKESYDETIFNSTAVSDLDKLILSSHYGAEPTEQKLLADNVIKFDPYTNKLIPTLSGILFFHNNPKEIIEGAEILFTKFESDDMSKILKTRDYSGPLVQMTNEVIADIKKELIIQLKRDNALLIAEKLLIPEIVLREVLINALIHRKYFIKDAIKIALFDNRLEVYSPGNFPGPITDFLSGISYSRNPHLRQLARNIGLVEKRGLGFPLIFSECKKNNNPSPQVIEQVGDFVKIILYFPLNSTTESFHQKNPNVNSTDILSSFKNKETFTLTEIANELRCSKNTASTRIKKYLDDGVIERIGKGRSIHYIWKK